MAYKTVWVRPLFWGGDFILGGTDSAGSIEVRGVHLGDIITTPGSQVTVDATKCAVTN